MVTFPKLLPSRCEGTTGLRIASVILIKRIQHTLKIEEAF